MSSSSPKAVASYDADYVFSLPADLRALAEEELRESDEVRRHALTAMREWLDQNPKIVKCRYDSSFLLRFLRAKKFSLPIVQQTLERYVMLREVFEDSVFTNVSLEEPNVADLLNRGLVFALPKRDPEGRRILLIRSKAIDPSKHTMRDVMRLFTITTDFLVEDEENQIRGFIYLVDAGGASMQMLTLATPKEAMRMIRNGEALVPMRHHLGIGYNIPSGLKYISDLAMGLLSEKLRSRVRQTNNLETCPEIDRSNLPKEMGGDRWTMEEMIGMWKEEMNAAEETRRLVELNNAMHVNVQLYTPRETKGEFNSSDTGKSITDSWGGLNGGIVGSFRKLEVD